MNIRLLLVYNHLMIIKFWNFFLEEYVILLIVFILDLNYSIIIVYIQGQERSFKSAT